MVKHTRKQIEDTRTWLKENNSPLTRINVGGRNLEFYVGPPAEGTPTNYAIGCKHNESGESVFGVCSTIPEEFRPYFALHEYIEYEEIGGEKQGRCVDALIKELSAVPQEIRRRYIPFRAEFFRNMVEYLNDKKYPSEMIEEVTFSRNYLNRLERKMRGN